MGRMFAHLLLAPAFLSAIAIAGPATPNSKRFVSNRFDERFDVNDGLDTAVAGSGYDLLVELDEDVFADGFAKRQELTVR